MATSILRRPVDLFIVAVLVMFAAIALTIDLGQAFYGSVQTWKEGEYKPWPPAFLQDQYIAWCKNVDPLLEKNPVWFETMAVFSPILYVPFYFLAIYAFIFEREWIRVPALMWGWGLVVTMIPILNEGIYGEYPTKDVTLYLAAYGGYLVMPVVIMLRVAWTPVFSAGKHKPE